MPYGNAMSDGIGDFKRMQGQKKQLRKIQATKLSHRFL